MKTVLLGYEVGPGNPVEIPLRNMAVAGQTQEAGKTTTMEALATRGGTGLRTLTFITKRGEGSFKAAHPVAPYLKEQSDWQYVASILEASRGEKLKFERAWIIRASKGAKTLADVQRNVRTALEKAKGLSADVYLTLDAYLDAVVPQIETVKWALTLNLRAGLNVMDLGALSVELQHLVIRSALEWVWRQERDTVVVIPEAWRFIPQGRGTPVKLAAEAYVRQGSALRNYLWLDSQDLGGIEKTILRSVVVWLLGVQRESNEIKRTLDNIPGVPMKPKPAEIATLKLGEFFACWGEHKIKTYVQPAWMRDSEAQAHARGRAVTGRVSRPPAPGITFDREAWSRDIAPRALEEFAARGVRAQHAVDQEIAKAKEDPTMCEQHQQLERELKTFQGRLDAVQKDVVTITAQREEWRRRADLAETRGSAAEDLARALAAFLPPALPGGGAGGTIDEEGLIRKILARVPSGNGGPVTVTPPEKLRKDFQQEEAERITATARAFKPLTKRVLKLMVALEGGYLPQKGIADRLGRSMGGNARVDLGAAVKELTELGWVTIDHKRGVATNLRGQIEADLQAYQPSGAEVDAVHQAVVHQLATEGAE